MSVVFIDLDHFKVLNDRFGHQAGDEVLARFGKMLASLVRVGDLLELYYEDAWWNSKLGLMEGYLDDATSYAVPLSDVLWRTHRNDACSEVKEMSRCERTGQMRAYLEDGDRGQR